MRNKAFFAGVGVRAVYKGEAVMFTRFALVPLALAATLTGAAAAEFYVVQDTATKRCQIVEQRPTSIAMVVVGDARVYGSRGEAETAMRSVEVCKSGDTGAAGPTKDQPK
jgi:hypothetical protein